MVLPLVLPYQTWYTFPFSLIGLVLAGFAITEVYERLRPAGRFASAAWLCVALGLNLPSLISYYADGSRVDMRSAAHYVAEHWHPGDRVASVRLETFQYYAPNREPAFQLPSGDEATAALDRLAAGPGRLWIVVDSTRGGLPAALQGWLNAHAAPRFHVSARRLDYFENSIDVFVRELR